MTTDTPIIQGANYRAIYAELCGQLPQRPDDTPDALATRDRMAMDAVVALNPENAFEARLAVRYVVADAHAGDCLREASLVAGDPAKLWRCRAQSISMSRQADSALRTLLRVQARREKQFAEAHPAAMERAGYWFRPLIVPEAPLPPPPAPAAAEPVPTQAEIDAEAERYAMIYPDRARRIREAGGLPARLDFGPPEPEIVAALLRGNGAASHPM